MFVLSANVLWTLTAVPKNIPFWELCAFIFCTVIIAIYPWFYAALAMTEGSSVGNKSFGTTKHGVLFLPSYRTSMLLAYCIWDILFVVYHLGDIGGLFHNGMAIVVAVIFVLAEGKKLSDTALFWAVSRALTLAWWIATYIFYARTVSLLECDNSEVYQQVDLDGVAVDILVIAMLATTTIGVIDLAWLFYITKKVTNTHED